MNIDTKHLLVREDGLAVRPSALANGMTICDFCSVKETGCDLDRVERCGQIVPALSFISDEGLESNFSTFRASSIWYDRAVSVAFRSGKFALVTKEGELVGHAKIKTAFRGSFMEMMRDHAWSNHMVKGLNLSKEEAAAYLTKWIRNSMGSRYTNDPDLICTTIYMQRLSS